MKGRPLFFDFCLPEPEGLISELQGAERWAWYGECMEELGRSVPVGDEPEVLGYYDEAETRRKEPALRWEAEEELLGETRELVVAMLEQKEVVNVSAGALFFLEERLRWCRELCLRLAQVAESGVCGGLAVEGAPGVVWRWLLIEFYESEFVFPVRWRERCSADGWY